MILKKYEDLPEALKTKEAYEYYSILKRTICINILNFKYLKTRKFHSGYRLKEI